MQRLFIQSCRVCQLVTAALLMLAVAACDQRSPAANSSSASAAPQQGEFHAASKAQPTSIDVSDDLGRTLQLEAYPKRVATTASFMVDYLIALNVKPVLRPDDSDESRWGAAAVKDIPLLAVSHSVGPNMEQLAAARPDLVVTTPMFGRFVEQIEQSLRVPVLVYEIDDIDDVPRQAERVGKLIGRPKAGRELAQSLRDQIASVPPISAQHRPTVFALFGTPAAFFAFQPKSYLGSMITALGGRLITENNSGGASSMSSQLTPFSLEVLAATDPDVILLVHHGPAQEMAATLQKRPVWSQLRAVREGRVHRISQYRYLTSPGTDVAEAMRELRKLMAEGASE